jgi:hypothetical protein
MDRQQKQTIINEVTNFFRNKQWFNGCGFTQDTLIIAYNYYTAFELKDVKEAMIKFGVQFEMKDIRVVLPGSQKDDVPPYIK